MQKKKTNSAKIDTEAILPPNIIHITINGSLYTFKGTSFPDSLLEAVDDHIEQDREFTEYISVSVPGSGTDEIYSPAVLCSFGYIGKDELAAFLMTNMVEEDDEPESG